MHFTFVTVAFASWLWLGSVASPNPLWSILERAGGSEKAGARWDPWGQPIADPDGPDSSTEEGAGWDPNG